MSLEGTRRHEQQVVVMAKVSFSIGKATCANAFLRVSPVSVNNLSSSQAAPFIKHFVPVSVATSKDFIPFPASIGPPPPFAALRLDHSTSHTGDQKGEVPHLLVQLPSHTDPTQERPEDPDPLLMPRHVAIIMDGNCRWAERRGWPSTVGYKAGVQALLEVLKLSREWGIQVLTVFAFSTENWLRSKREVDSLMHLFENELDNFVAGNVQVHCIGDLSLLPESLRKVIARLEGGTRHNTGLKFSIALNYSGRQDIVGACQRLAVRVREGELSVSHVTESAIDEELKTSWAGKASDPDLLIRTSGEQRLSNFFLWQSAYTEFFFADILWPDFGEAQFKDALLAYQQRDRRYGKRTQN